ncbi:galacturonokinase isoform X2 [Cannabis sativa]|uniref:galacturonokinase isoform X2 n=1 Tax=Cannabis sativa TaxID=3483 RepID=UPI0029C9B54F|nr:galacturonokinase isoform X2 [Cannabis sativa]
MDPSSWPSQSELKEIRDIVAALAGRCIEDVRVVASPYRICPLGAHIDHQGGTVSAMAINRGVLLGFIPSSDSQVVLRSGQFKGEVKFSVNEIVHPKHKIEVSKNDANDSSKQYEECDWGNYARGALYALQRKGNHISQGIIGYLRGSDGLDSSGLSSSAAVGVAYLLALESANNLKVPPEENIEYDRLIENEYLGLKNGILDQSAILLSSHGCLLCMNCKCFRIWRSGASSLKCSTGGLSSTQGLEAWATGSLEDFGKLITASGLSSIQNYECGSEPLIQLYKILVNAPGVFGARFSGAGFRGCCIALVNAEHADEAASFVRREYQKIQPELASQWKQDKAVLICEAGDSARVISS